MLSDLELAAFRAKVSTSHHRRTFKRPPVWTRYVDGPLDGLRFPSDGPEANYVGWCHPTKQGPVLAMYAHVGPGVVKFLEWSMPGQR